MVGINLNFMQTATLLLATRLFQILPALTEILLERKSALNHPFVG